VIFGESIAAGVKEAAEQAIDESVRPFVLGTYLATYLAWGLARRAQKRGVSMAILKLGGVRGLSRFPSQKIQTPQSLHTTNTPPDKSRHSRLPIIALISAIACNFANCVRFSIMWRQRECEASVILLIFWSGD
jgi:hypothetical protein